MLERISYLIKMPQAVRQSRAPVTGDKENCVDTGAGAALFTIGERLKEQDLAVISFAPRVAEDRRAAAADARDDHGSRLRGRSEMRPRGAEPIRSIPVAPLTADDHG